MDPHWYPLCLDEALQAQPLAVQLMGQALVLWRDSQGQPVLMADQCPHRGAPLSMGRIDGDQLQCPYHGWRFDTRGRCVGIPAVPSFLPPASHAVCRYPVAAAHGLWWGSLRRSPAALPGAAPANAQPAAPLSMPVSEAPASPPTLPPLPARRLLFGPFDVATSAPRVVENFLDTAHFAHVHAGWLGHPQHAEVPATAVHLTDDGRPVVERYPAWQPRATASAAEGGWVSYRYEVLGPTSAWLRKQPDDGSPSDAFTMWVCPLDDEHSRLWMGQYTEDSTSSDEALRDFQMTIFGQDRPILEAQRPRRLPLHAGEVHCAADRLSAAYRRYLLQAGIGCGVC